MTRRVSTAFIGAVALAEYLIVDAGFAITRLNFEESQMSLALFEEIAAQPRTAAR